MVDRLRADTARGTIVLVCHWAMGWRLAPHTRKREIGTWYDKRNRNIAMQQAKLWRIAFSRPRGLGKKSCSP